MMITPLDQWDTTRWPNFSFQEFQCQETQEMKMDERLLDAAQELREKRGKGLVIASGYISPNHSIERTKVNGPGLHSEGLAFDPKVRSGDDLDELVRLGILCGFTGFGLQNRDGKVKMHMDIAPNGLRYPRPWIWTY